MPLRRRRHRKAYPMKRLILPLLAAAFFAALPSSAAPNKELIGEQSGPGEIFDVLEPVWLILRNVEADCTDVWADWQQDSTKVRIYLTHTSNLSSVFGDLSGAGWYAKLPINHAGKAYYTYTTVSEGTPTPYGYDSDGNPTYSYTINENTTSASALGPARYPLIDKWAESGTSLDSNWNGYNYEHSKSVVEQKIKLLGTSDPSSAPVEDEGRSISVLGQRGLLRAPKLPDGIGTIWLKARMATLQAGEGLLRIDRLTALGDRYDRTWTSTTLAEIRIPPPAADNQWQQFRLILQEPPPHDDEQEEETSTYYIIYNNTFSGAGQRQKDAIEISDIILTPPIPEVEIVKDRIDYAAEGQSPEDLPSLSDPIVFHVEVRDVYHDSAPARFITPRLVWRQGGETVSWKEKVMTNVQGRAECGKPGTYACVLTKDDDLRDGAFEYFYEVGFTGYTPVFPSIKYYGNQGFNDVVNVRFGRGEYDYLIDSESLSMLTVVTNETAVSPIGQISECRSPAIYPDFDRQYHPDFLYPFDENTSYVSEYQDLRASAEVAPNSAATNSLWGYTRRFDLRNLVTELNAETEAGTVNLWRAPRASVWSMFRFSAQDAHAVPVTNQVLAEYKYLAFRTADGIRRFRSRYTGLGAVTEDAPGAAKPSLLDPSYDMQQVGDYTWQAIIHITNRIDSIFSVTGACPTASGLSPTGTNDIDKPVVWMQVDQDRTAWNPPMSGEFSVDPNTHVTNHSELVLFPTEGRTEWVKEVVERSETTRTPGDPVLFDAGTIVGVVTNEDFTFLSGGTVFVKDPESWPHAPTDADVAFWYGHLVTSYEEVGWDEENAEAVMGWVTNVVPDIPRNVWVSGDAVDDVRLRDYGVWLSGNFLAVTNSSEKVFATNIVETTRYWTETTDVQRTYYVPVIPDEMEDSEFGTRVDIDYDGFLMFRFCTTNGSYQIRRAAWQDFNEWQADNDYYDQSFGLYDMKTFTSDLEGRALTRFGGEDSDVTIRSLDKAAPTSAWSDEDGVTQSGLRLKKARIVRERARPPDWTPTDTTTRNNGILLLSGMLDDTDVSGSVVTTEGTDNREMEDGVVTGGGRDTLTMWVRSYSDDARSITYQGNGADDWSNYRVVARIMSPNADDVSPGEHSVSLIGYYKNALNYWEARIIQKSEFTGQDTTPVRNWFEVHVYKWVKGKATEVYGHVSRAGDGNRYRGDGNPWGRNYSYDSSATRMATWPVWNDAANTGATNARGYSGGQADYGLFTSTYSGGWTFVFDLKTVGSGSSATVQPVVWAWRNSDITGDTDSNNLLKNNYYKYDCSEASNLTGGSTKGRPGWNTRDCGLKIGCYVLDNAGETPEKVKFTGSTAGSVGLAYTALSKSESPDDWDDNEIYNPQMPANVWNHPGLGIDGFNGTSNIGEYPSRVKRKAPKVWYGVEVCRTGEEEYGSGTAPDDGWDSDWDDYHGNTYDQPQSVAQWTWKKVQFPMKFWDDTFIRIRSFAVNPDTDEVSMGMLMVDGLECSPWRGKTIVDPEGSKGGSGWRAYYSAIVVDPYTLNGVGRRYELDRTRANPTETAPHPQTLVTPPLENGVGGLLFSYEVKEYPVRINVQMGNETGSTWTSAEGYPRELPVTPVGEKPTLYVPFLHPGDPGRMRIVALDENEESRDNGRLGTLFVDNVRATDYPKSGDSSWEVYNALVSDFTQSLAKRRLKFDGLSDEAWTMRSMVLNDATGGQGTAAETLLDRPLPDHAPFVQTPSIETGVGEISFWYRADPSNADGDGGPAKIALLVAPDASEGRPDATWRPLEIKDLWPGDSTTPNPNYANQVAALHALTNIVPSTEWTYFNVEFYLKDDHVLRIVSGDGTTPGEDRPDRRNRVMLDNVLITEPVRSSIDVGTIEFLPGVPTTREDTGAKVTLVNPRMNPHEITVYLDWFVGTDSAAALASLPVETVEVPVKTTRDPATVHYDTINHEIVEDEERFNDPGVVVATYDVVTYVTNTMTTIDETVVPRALLDEQTRPWGYGTWSNLVRRTSSLHSGTLGFTNSTDDPYTFWSTNTIPTTKFEPDTPMQYVVRVDYKGQFSQPVDSETQGRVKNGFWFRNPDWYDPIDLNVAFGTEEKPVAHVFVFSCTTNAVRINEFRQRLGTENHNHQDQQFVELLGPIGATLGQWRLEHWWSLDNKAVDPSVINYTNVLASGAAFSAPEGVATNKGWGFYILGNSAVEQADEPLFPIETETDDGVEVEPSHPFINTFGAMRLRRRMGAYVDRIAWGTGTQTSSMERDGFVPTGYVRNATKESAAGKSLSLEGDFDSRPPKLAWATADSATPGGFAVGQFDLLPWLDDTVEEKPICLIDRPVFTDLSFETVEEEGNESTYAILTFRVSVTNDVALDPSSPYAYEWSVQSRATLTSDWGPASGVTWFDESGAEITAPALEANGTGLFQARLPANQGIRFYRIKAFRDE